MEMLHNKYNQYFPSWINYKRFILVKILPIWTTHSVIKYTRFITNILHTNDPYTVCPINKVHVNNLHTSEPHTGCYPPSLTELVSVCCPPSPSLGWYQACLTLPHWGGIRLVWPAAESQSPGYRSVCVTHVLTHLGPHPRRCQGVWTPHPEKPQNKNIYIKLTHNFTNKTNFCLSLYMSIQDITCCHPRDSDSLIKSPALQSWQLSKDFC